MMICDAHCHLDLMDDMVEFVNEIQKSDMSLFAVGTTPKAYSRVLQCCRNFKSIFVGLGMHPQLISSGYDDMQLFESLFSESHYIGEVGLDFGKGYIQTKELQIKVFSGIIKLCEQYGERVVSIHALKSTNKVIEILETYKNQKSNKYIFHWFTGSISQMERAIEIGCYFSVNPRMLETKSGVEVIKKIPYDRMLLETDAPFVSKMKQVGVIKKKLEEAVSKISDIVGRNVSYILNENAKEIFRY